MMYSNDTALQVAKKHVEELEESSYITISKAQKYSLRTDLVSNETKTQLNFGRTTSEIRGEQNINLKNNAKYLGVIKDHKLI